MYLLNLAILFLPWTYCSTLAIKNNSKYFSMHCALLTRTQNYYRPQRSCGQGNIFKPVCHSFYSRGGEGICLSACWDTTPRKQTPPGADTPPPGADTPQEQTPWTPRSRHPPPKSRYPPGADTHPPGADPPGSRPPPPREQTPLGSRLQHMVYEQPVCILLECILVLV